MYTLSSSAQNDEVKIKANFKQEPLELVFLKWRLDYKLEIDFWREDILDIRITKSFSKKPLSEAFEILLKNTGLDFRTDGPRKVAVFLKKEEKAAPENRIATRSDFTIAGIVKDQKTGESLPFTNIVVKGTSFGTSSNVDGYFTLFNVPSDTALLQVQYIGYKDKTFRLFPKMDMENLIIFLEDISQTLEEVVVIGANENQLIKASSGISKIAVSPAQLAALPSFGEKDIFRSLQLLPGISGTNESSSGLYVRGGTPDQNLVLFDGFTVYHVDHLFGFFSAFNTSAIKDVQLYKGGFEAKYGGRLSSVVELTGKDGNTEEFNIGFGASLLSVNGFVEAPFANGKGSFLVAGRRSFQSQFYNNLFDSFTQINQASNEAGPGPGGGGAGGRFGFQEVKPNSYFYDLNAKTTYRPTSKDVISLSFYNGQDNLDNSRNTDNSAFGGRFGGQNANIQFQSNNTDLTDWGNWGTSAKWSRKWNSSFYSNANFSYSNYYSQRDRNNETTIVREDSTIYRKNGSYEYNDLRDFTFKLDNEWQISQNNQLDFGLHATYNDIEYEFTRNDTINELNRDDQGLTTAIYLQDRHTFGEKLVLKGGLRAVHYNITNKLYLEPRTSVSYLLTDKFKLKAAYGKYNQFATRIIREDIQQGSRDFWLLANDDNAPVSSAIHYIGGMSYETPSWLFDVEAYYKSLQGLSEYTTRFVRSGFGPRGSLEYEELFYHGDGVAKGVEFLLQKKAGQLTGWLSYTLGEVKYDFADFGDVPFFANQDQTHELKLVGSYRLRNWTFGATFIYATGKPYTAPTGYYEVTLLDGTSSDYFEISAKNALRLPDYHRFDLSATYDFKMGNSNASAGLSVFNVYNRSNVWYKEYEVIEGELLETNISLLDFTPSLFFSWKFR